MVVPSGNRIRYASPDADDFEPHNLMKSSAFLTQYFVVRIQLTQNSSLYTSTMKPEMLIQKGQALQYVASIIISNQDLLLWPLYFA
jgi:hypothetical protein